ncbi:hypothetical protein KUDE01_000572 [Dissostichus eleginoides]|uniref:Uncharacterized protein n=1 Tax=Dissostichus eleginoides TaxID=100907 RepID=A0AAD9CEW6_DISEL|nr:hypothetical protein KUDE01_000572 [Dissostichus eleginoides]
MAATEASAAPVVQEDGKTPESKPTEAEQPANNANANSETVNSEVVDKDGTAVNSEVVDNKETVNNDTAAVTGAEEGEAAASEDAAPTQSSEGASTAEPKTSFLDSFLNKSGLGKVMGGRKKKEPSTAAGGEENAAEGGEKEGEKGGEEAAAAEGGAEGVAEGDAATEKAPENGEKEEEKKAEKKPAESKSSVRDLIRKPVARIFSHRSTDKKEGAEPKKTVRSKSLDRMEDPEALNATTDSTIEEGGAAGGAEGEAEGGAEGEQKAPTSSATTKHMKRWHSFKKLMAQKESGQKRWTLKRSWTFQGLKRDPSIVGISGKAKGSDKDSADKTDEEKRVIPKSKRANTECVPSGEEEAAAAPASGEDGAAEEGKDAKTAKAKRSHYGRAVSLKNFILRKGKSTSVDMGETNEKNAVESEKTPAEEKTPVTENGEEEAKVEEKTPTPAPVTNGENGCSNGNGEDDATHNHQEEEKTTASSPVKKSKDAGGVKEEANAKIINTTAAVNSDKKAGNV